MVLAVGGGGAIWLARAEEAGLRSHLIGPESGGGAFLLARAPKAKTIKFRVLYNNTPFFDIRYKLNNCENCLDKDYSFLELWQTLHRQVRNKKKREQPIHPYETTITGKYLYSIAYTI